MIGTNTATATSTVAFESPKIIDIQIINIQSNVMVYFNPHLVT